MHNVNWRLCCVNEQCAPKWGEKKDNRDDKKEFMFHDDILCSHRPSHNS